jgi:hypothetical protein
MPLNPLAWLDSDREWYPVWPTTLYEQQWIWRERFDLFSLDACVERLAQEAKLFLITNSCARERGET